MPFTFSHPAIVLPLLLLHRRWFSVTGLVVGSVIPDFEYFIRMRVKSIYSHTVWGLFWFDLPLALLLAFLFHDLIRNSLYENLPVALQKRLLPYTSFDWNSYFRSNWPVVIVSVLIGAASHLLWDSFTHENGFFVQAISNLTPSIHLLGLELPAFKVLQHLSTLLGGATVALVLYNLPTHKIGNEKVSLHYWVTLVTITTIIITIRILSGLSMNMYGHLIATAIAGFTLSLTLTPFLVRK